MSAPLTSPASIVHAPGKAMIFGEYAVLDGAPAIVAAVDRYAVAELRESRGATSVRSPSPFISVAASRARSQLVLKGRTPPRTFPVVDSSSFYLEGRKLGLGSSAAVTVAAYGAILNAAGVTLEDRDGLFDACDRAHAEAQGVRGSGADIAAAVYGGVLRFQRRVESNSVAPIAWPASIAVTLIDTGRAASTASLVKSYRGIAASRPSAYRKLVRHMAEVASDFSEVIETEQSLAGICEAVDAWNNILHDLSGYLDYELLTPAHQHAMKIARQFGGSAKPSGAGGGDLAICFCPIDALAPLRRELVDKGLNVLEVALGGPGVAVGDRPTGVLHNHPMENSR